MKRSLRRRRRKHLANLANVLALLDAADVAALGSNAMSGPPQIRTLHGTLSFEDDGTIRASIIRRPELHVVT